MSNNEEIKVETNKKNKKIYIIVAIIAAILIIAITITTFVIIKSNKDYEIEEIKEFSYFKLYKNQKYGVIDKKGNIIIEPKYELIDIPNPSKAIFIGSFDYNSETGEYQTEVLNEKNEKIFTNYAKVLPLMFKEATAEVPYEKSVLKYKENGKFGIIDFNGKKITNAIYDSIESLLYKEGCLIVGQDSKYGVITIKGVEIIKPEYDSINADGYYNDITKYKKSGFIVGNKKSTGYRYGYINSDGEVILKDEYNEVDRVTEIEDEDIYLLAFRNGQAGIYKNKTQIVKHEYEEIEYNKINKLFILLKNSKQGVVNNNGDVILPVEYDYVLVSSNKINAQKDNQMNTFDINGNKQEDVNHLTYISTDNENYTVTIDENEKFGILDKNGNTVIENKYEYIEYAYKDYFIVTENGKVGVLDKEENKKIDFKYNVIQKVESSNILQAIMSNDYTTDLYNSNIEKVISMKDAIISSQGEYIKISSENNMKYYDKNGNEISNKEIFKNNTLFASYKDGKWGFINSSDEVKVEQKYDMVTEINKYGYAGIKLNGKWGVINSSGKIIVEPMYEIEWQNPEFIEKYCKLNFGYGLEYYTDELVKE